MRCQERGSCREAGRIEPDRIVEEVEPGSMEISSSVIAVVVKVIIL